MLQNNTALFAVIYNGLIQHEMCRHYSNVKYERAGNHICASYHCLHGS